MYKNKLNKSGSIQTILIIVIAAGLIVATGLYINQKRASSVDTTSAQSVTSYLHKYAQGSHEGVDYVISDIGEGRVSVQAPNKDFYVGVTENEAGFEVDYGAGPVEEDETGSRDDTEDVNYNLSKMSELINKKLLSLGLRDIGRGDMFKDVDGYLLENDFIVCDVPKSFTPAKYSCVNKTSIIATAEKYKPFAEAQKTKQGSEYTIYISDVEESDGQNGFRVARASVGFAKGDFYQKTNGTWVFVIGMQATPPCDEYEKDPNAALAFEGTACYRDASSSENSKVTPAR